VTVKFVVTVNIHFRMTMEGNQRLCITFSRQTPTQVFFFYIYFNTQQPKSNFLKLETVLWWLAVSSANLQANKQSHTHKGNV